MSQFKVQKSVDTFSGKKYAQAFCNSLNPLL